MGTIVAFPADASTRRGPPRDAAEAWGEVVILPVVRIERYDDAPTTDRGPEEGTPRRRRRRARS